MAKMITRILANVFHVQLADHRRRICVTQQGGRRDGGVIAYDLGERTEKWRWMDAGPSTVARGYGSRRPKVIIAPTEAKWWRSTRPTANSCWEMPYSQGRYNSATPIVDGSTLILAGPGSGMTAFKMQKQGDKLVEEKLWGNTDNSLGFNTPVWRKACCSASRAATSFLHQHRDEDDRFVAPIAKAAPAARVAEGGRAHQKQPSCRPVVQFVQQEGQPESKNQPEDRPRRARTRTRAAKAAADSAAAAWSRGYG